jgi:hypothetical protein
MFAVPSFFGYNTTFVSTPVATAATGVGETSFTANWNAFAGAQYYLLDVSTSSSFSSFVGSYQNFVVLTTSQLVSGLTASTTYYYRLRAATGVDADAASFFSRVYTAGGALSYTEVSATETLVADMKSAGVWTAMKAVYPMVGGGTGSTAAREAACAQNLKSSSFTGTFSSGWTFASTGVTPDGFSAYMDTAFNNQANWTSTLNGSMGFVSRTNESSSVCDMGAGNITSGANSSTIFAGFLGTYYGGLNCTTVAPGASNTSTIGFFATSRISSSDYSIYKRGSSIINLTTTDSIGTNPNQNIYLGAGNNGGSASRFSNKEFNFCFIGDGLTQTEVDNYWTALQTFNSTLSR